MKRITLAILTVAILGGCATKSGTQALKTEDTRACAQNFTYDGSFWKGRKYKTNVIMKKVSKKTAMTRASRYLLKDGWTIANSNNELGIISASQTVSFGQGKTVPLNISIEPKKTGIKVDITFATSGGVTAPLESIVSQFCSVVEAVEG